MEKANCLLCGTLPTSYPKRLTERQGPLGIVEPTVHLMVHQVLLTQMLLLRAPKSQRLRKEDYVEVVSGLFVIGVGEASGNH